MGQAAVAAMEEAGYELRVGNCTAAAKSACRKWGESGQVSE